MLLAERKLGTSDRIDLRGFKLPEDVRGAIRKRLGLLSAASAVGSGDRRCSGTGIRPCAAPASQPVERRNPGGVDARDVRSGRRHGRIAQRAIASLIHLSASRSTKARLARSVCGFIAPSVKRWSRCTPPISLLILRNWRIISVRLRLSKKPSTTRSVRVTRRGVFSRMRTQVRIGARRSSCLKKMVGTGTFTPISIIVWASLWVGRANGQAAGTSGRSTAHIRRTWRRRWGCTAPAVVRKQPLNSRLTRAQDIPRAADHLRRAEAVLSKGPENPDLVKLYFFIGSVAAQSCRVPEAVVAVRNGDGDCRAVRALGFWAMSSRGASPGYCRTGEIGEALESRRRFGRSSTLWTHPILLLLRLGGPDTASCNCGIRAKRKSGGGPNWQSPAR